MPDFAACSSSAAGAPVSPACSSSFSIAIVVRFLSLYPTHEPAGVHDPLRVELAFDAPHQPQLRAEQAPRVQAVAQLRRGVEEDETAATAGGFAPQALRELP